MRKILSIVLIGGILMSIFSGCSAAKHNVICDESFEGNKGAYREGAKVELYYDMIATDTDYSFFVDDERFHALYDESKGYVIEFTMPAHDVTVRVESKNSMVNLNNKSKKGFKLFAV